MEVIISFGVVLLLLIMALFLLNGKGAFLIAGYNTMSEEKKEKYDEIALCRFTGWLLVIIAACLSLIPIGLYFDWNVLISTGTGLIVVVAIGGAIFANIGNRFKK